MITINPAQALGLDAKIGGLAPGLKADITVLRAAADDPHESLLRSHPQDVEMVWISGELLYGRADLVQLVKPDRCESAIVNGAAQRLRVRDDRNPVAATDQTLAQIRALC